MTFCFSPITSGDIKQLMPIENACHSHPWNEKVFSSCVGGRYFGYYLTREDSSDETPVILGFYVGDYIAGESTLMDICIEPKFQGQGLGKKLLKHFIAQAKNSGASKVLLEVRARNISAQMMYINNGFSEIGRRTGYYPSTVGYEDAIVMSRRL